jgi:hypothetical protein
LTNPESVLGWSAGYSRWAYPTGYSRHSNRAMRIHHLDRVREVEDLVRKTLHAAR